MSEAQPREERDETSPQEEPHDRMPDLRRLAMLGNLAGGLGHDLRNLTMPVLLRLDVLSQSDEVPSSIRSDLSAIRASIDQLQRLANGLRLLATDPRDPVGEGEGTDLVDWWNDVMPLLRDTLGPKTNLVSRFDAELPAVSMSPGQLAQVIIFLATNARQAMEDVESPVFSVIAKRLGDFVQVDVSDNGIGMDAETRARCFEPFFSTHPRQLSTGLGLSSARAMVLRFGGDLSLAPSRGTGTTLRLQLPLRSERNSVSSKHHVTQIVLRDPRHRALTRLLLAKRGIDEWKGGTATRQDHPDVVICDADEVESVLLELGEWEADATTRVIAIGSPGERKLRRHIVWVSPSKLSALSEAMD